MKAYLSLIAAAALLSACATAPMPKSEAASLPVQSALYMVGENSPPAEKSVEEQAQDDASMARRVYWYFAGR
jgi:hypothetical protein